MSYSPSSPAFEVVSSQSDTGDQRQSDKLSGSFSNSKEKAREVIDSPQAHQNSASEETVTDENGTQGCNVTSRVSAALGSPRRSSPSCSVPISALPSSRRSETSFDSSLVKENLGKINQNQDIPQVTSRPAPGHQSPVETHHPYYNIPRPPYRDIDESDAARILNAIKDLSEDKILTLFCDEDRLRLRGNQTDMRSGESTEDTIPCLIDALKSTERPDWQNVVTALNIYTSDDVPEHNSTNKSWRLLVYRVAQNHKQAGQLATVIKRVLYEAPRCSIDDNLIVFIAELGTRWSIQKARNGTVINDHFKDMWAAITEVLTTYPIYNNLKWSRPNPKLRRQQIELAKFWIDTLQTCVLEERRVSSDAFKLEKLYFSNCKIDTSYEEYQDLWRLRFWEGIGYDVDIVAAVPVTPED